MANAALSTIMGTIGGSYSFDSAQVGDAVAVQQELEFATDALYQMSTQRIDYSMSRAIPGMTAQLKSDMTYANLYTTLAPDYERARAGLSVAVAKSTTDSLAEMRAGLSPAMRFAYLQAAESLVHRAATMMAVTFGLSRSSEYEAFRKRRDDAYSMLFGGIELATKVRGLGDALSAVDMSDAFNAVKEAIGAKQHELTMQSIEWERAYKARSFNTKAFDIGAIASNAIQGIGDGYSRAGDLAGTTVEKT